VTSSWFFLSTLNYNARSTTHQTHYLLTYSKVQSSSWAANWFAARQEIPRISRNPKVHYRTHKRTPHYNGKSNKQDGSIPKQTVHGIEKLEAYLEMSCKNKTKPHIFVGRAKSVLCSATDCSRIRLLYGLYNYFNVLERHDNCAEAIQI